MTELNPNHPVTQEIRQHWHKLCAIALFTLDVRELEITVEDMEKFTRELGDDAAIVVKAKGKILTLKLVKGEEAKRLVKDEGGLEF